MFESIADALGSIQAALEISKAVAGIAVNTKVGEQQAEITGKLIEAQRYILQMQADHAAALSRASEAEERLRQMEAALTDLKRYELVEVHPEHFALRVKPGLEREEIPHYACPYCAQKGIRSVMRVRNSHRDFLFHNCPKCRHSVPEERKRPRTT